MDSRLLIVTISFPIWLFLIIYFRKYRQWLLYYLFAAFGFTLILTLLAEHFNWDQILVNVAAFHAALTAKFFGVPDEILNNGRILINNANILKLGIECSAILEILTLVGLVLFYPAYGWKNKIFKIAIGVAATYTINILRMLVIILFTYKFGISYVFIAHAIVGRLLFFFLMIGIYWLILTGPTIETIGASLREKVKIEQIRAMRAIGIKRLILGIAFLVAFVLSFAGSFYASPDWKIAFEKPVKISRPIIYPEETEAVKCPGCGAVLGEKTEAQPQIKKNHQNQIMLFPETQERMVEEQATDSSVGALSVGSQEVSANQPWSTYPFPEVKDVVANNGEVINEQ